MTTAIAAECKKVLFVDDEPIICRFSTKVLSIEGYQVDTAQNGLIARDMAEAQPYDVCVTDIRTPQMNGIQLYDHFMKNNPSLAEKTIFITGDIISEDVAEFIKAKSPTVLVKPFSPQDLVCAVRNKL